MDANEVSEVFDDGAQGLELVVARVRRWQRSATSIPAPARSCGAAPTEAAPVQGEGALEAAAHRKHAGALETRRAVVASDGGGVGGGQALQLNKAVRPWHPPAQETAERCCGGADGPCRPAV